MNSVVNTSPFKIMRDKITSEHYNVKDDFKSNTVAENKTICLDSSIPMAIGAVNLSGSLNLGMMIRSSSLLGAERFFIFGRKKYDKRSTVGANHYIDIEHYSDIVSHIGSICYKYNYQLILVEHGGFELPLTDYYWETLCNGKSPLFLFGSESEGFDDDLLVYAKITRSPIISIPQLGVLRSFNVSSAMSIVAWEYNKFYNKK